MRILIALLLLVLAWPAQAQPDNQSWRTIRKEFKIRNWDGSYSYGHRYVRVPYEPRVYGYERRFEDDRRYEEPRHCRDIKRAVGDQHLTPEGAKKAANDAWAGTIRFHLGEKFMDLTNARLIVYTCSRSSIKDGSGITTLGQTLTRCEIEAQPCMAPKEVDESKQ